MRLKFLQFIFALFFIFCFLGSEASRAQIFAGKIFLQVEQKGEAWYVNPADGRRYYLGRPNDAFRVMKETGLGISEESFEDFQKNRAPQKLSGFILLRAEALGEAYYVDLEKLELIYLGRPADAFALIRSEGVGIRNIDLEKIEIAEGFGLLERNDPLSFFTIKEHCASELEIDLAERINRYRKTKGLSAIPLSRSLSYVAKVHLIDLVRNNSINDECNAHSWSDKGSWKQCCYPLDSNCIESKASELTDYKALAAENIHWWEDAFHTPSPEGALSGWIDSHGHHIVIINEEWAKDFEWKALGVAIYKNYAAMWVGPEEDRATELLKCESCENFSNKDLQRDCYSNKAIFFGDKNYCGFIENPLAREHCVVRADIYGCSEDYKKENFDCYRELVKKNELICDYIYKSQEDIDNCHKFSKYNK